MVRLSQNRLFRRRAAILLGLAMAGCADRAPDAAADPAPSAASLHRVGSTVGAVERQISGTVRLRRETPLAFLADGRIATLLVREGDIVASGQILATLDRTAVDASVLAADARAAQAASELARQRRLLEQGWVAKARVEQAEAAARAAEADRQSARFVQAYSIIRAPAAGIILARQAEPGQTLAAGTPVVVLGEFASGFVLRVPLTAGEIAGLARGDMASVRFRDGAAPDMTGRLIEIAGRADPRTGTFLVEYSLPAHPSLRSGQIADVTIEQRGEAGRLVVPTTALFAARADEGFVWFFDSRTRRISARLVRLGAVLPDGVEVRSGLSAGDLIIAGGVDRLVEGQKVSPVAAGASAG
ncbi:MAG: efflux RND transporter periplasmic adaptor subunit [Sphingomonadaceae bacterium]